LYIDDNLEQPYKAANEMRKKKTLTGTDIERATRKGTVGFVGSLDGYDWTILESKSGRCDIRVHHGGPGPENCHVIAKKAMWVYTPQIIADFINKTQTEMRK